MRRDEQHDERRHGGFCVGGKARCDNVQFLSSAVVEMILRSRSLILFLTLVSSRDSHLPAFFEICLPIHFRRGLWQARDFPYNLDIFQSLT